MLSSSEQMRRGQAACHLCHMCRLRPAALGGGGAAAARLQGPGRRARTSPSRPGRPGFSPAGGRAARAHQSAEARRAARAQRPGGCWRPPSYPLRSLEAIKRKPAAFGGRYGGGGGSALLCAAWTQPASAIVPSTQGVHYITGGDTVFSCVAGLSLALCACKNQNSDRKARWRQRPAGQRGAAVVDSSSARLYAAWRQNHKQISHQPVSDSLTLSQR